MRTFIVSKTQSGKRIGNLLKDIFPRMPVSSMHKAFRKKDIKVSSARVKDTHIVSDGDVVEVYIIDNILDGSPCNGSSQRLNIVFEDQNIIIVNKEQGISVYDDEGGYENINVNKGGDTLIDLVKSYLIEKGEYDEKGGSFAPALCHRLDRNTGGLVIIAKKEAALRIMLDKIKEREINKYYLCYVKGHLKNSKGVMEAYLYKDEKNSRVFVSDRPGKGKLTIITGYRVLEYIKGETSETDLTYVEVELLTGRTHQIRAHFAYSGHPLLGDGKYGINTLNRKYGVKYQALWAYKIKFDFQGEENLLSYLNGRVFEVKPEFNIGKL